MRMKKLSRSASLAIIYTALLTASQSNQGPDSYAPVYVDCPSNLSVRNASDGLSDEERSWRDTRSQRVIPALQSYLELANIQEFDVQGYIRRLNSSSLPVVGLSISGGGTQSGLGGLGVWQAYDARYQPAVEARTGGLTQILTYLTGLSGGGAVTVSLIAANNFSSTSDIVQSANFSTSYSVGRTDNTTEFFEMIFENAGAKAEAGFTVSLADTFGQFWGVWLPEDLIFANYSDLASNDSAINAFAMGAGPMPIMAFSEVIPGQSPEIGKIAYPGRNATNGFSLTSYEITPFEFGSWAGGRVQAFMPTRQLGSSMSGGSPVNGTCVEGFDKLTVIQGTTAEAFPAYLIDAFYKIPIFAKRSDGGSSSSVDDIPIPKDQEDNPFVQLVNQTASEFDQTFKQSLWATYPNPFLDYNEEMRGVEELLLLDGSLAGETNPIRPLIIPDRGVDFIIVYEASSDAKYRWVNGTNLINTAQSASEGSIPFPEIPDVNTMISLNLTRQPTFFGCSDSSPTPLVLYLPNSPWSAYSNFSYTQTSFTDQQVNLTLGNAFQLATYGNGTVDDAWPACLACAVVRGSLSRLGISEPAPCGKCFRRHCWDGSTADNVTESDVNPVLRLEPQTAYDDWNKTAWSAGKKEGEDDSDGLGERLHTERRATYAVIVAISVALFV